MAEHLRAEVVERALSGDPAALRRLVDTHQDVMLNLAFRVTGGAEAAWTICSDVFLRLLEHPESVAGREGTIEEPLLRGVWTLARRGSVTFDQVPRDDRAVEAVATAALRLPDRERCALALGDLAGLAAADVAAVLDINADAATGLLSRSRLDLAEGLGVRGRDTQLVEQEAKRLYRLWPAMDADDLAPDVIAEGRRLGLVEAGAARGRGEGPVIGGVRITPAIGLAILLVPLLIAAAIAVAVRSGGDGGDPVTPVTTGALTDAGTDGLDPLLPTTRPSTRSTTNSVSTVSTSSTDGGSGGATTPAAPVDPEPDPVAPTTEQAPEPEPEPEPEPAPTVTREPGGGAPPAPTTTSGSPAPATTSGGGAQPPPPASTGAAQVPLPSR